MFLYVEKEQIWVKIASTGGKVNSQNEHFKKKKDVFTLLFKVRSDV